MRNYLYIIILIAVALVGCQKDVPPMSDADDASFYLSASTESNITRVPYEQTEPSATPEGTLRAAIWASSNDASFENNGWNGKTDANGADVSGQVAIHTTANFVSARPQLLTAAVYPANGQTVHFIGLHPQAGWGHNGSNTQAVTSANFTFNGSQDVMFAPRKAGTYDSSNSATNIVNLHFYHLLTLLKIKIFAESQEAKTAWGNVKSITIKSKNKATIDIVGTYDYTNHSNVTYQSTENEYVWLPIYRIGSNEVFASNAKPYSLSCPPEVTKPQEVAYVLCSPVEAKDKVLADGASEVWVEVPEYTLEIETENRHVQLPIDLRKNETTFFTGSTRATCFTLNLAFKMGNTIVATADVDDWKYGGTGNVEL